MKERLKAALDWLSGALAVVVAIVLYGLVAFTVFLPFDFLASGRLGHGAATSAMAGLYLATGPLIAVFTWSFGRAWCEHGWDDRDSLLKWSFPLLTGWLSLPIATHVVSCLATLAGFPRLGGAIYAVRYESVFLFPMGVVLGAMGYGLAASFFARIFRRSAAPPTAPTPPSGKNASSHPGIASEDAGIGREFEFASL